MKSGAERRRRGVQSLERTLDVLEFLGSSEQEFGVSEIGAATGLSAGTVHRLTWDARLAGLRPQEPEDATVRPGFAGLDDG
jgi:IclR family transcriptional regulator, acetate operon repressor